MRSELEMPFEFPGVGIESEHRAGVQILARAKVAVVIRPWIAGTPVDQVQLRVVGAVVPGGRAAGLPGIARPGAEIGFAGLGNRVEAPEMFACSGVVSIQESGDAVLATGHSDDDLVLYREGSAGRCVTSGFRVVEHFG